MLLLKGSKATAKWIAFTGRKEVLKMIRKIESGKDFSKVYGVTYQEAYKNGSIIDISGDLRRWVKIWVSALGYSTRHLSKHDQYTIFKKHFDFIYRGFHEAREMVDLEAIKNFKATGLSYEDQCKANMFK